MATTQSESTSKQRRWKVILNIVTVVALVVLIIASHKQLTDTVSNLARVHAWYLLLIIPVEVVNYIAQTKMYQGMFKTLGDKISFKSLLNMSIELNFVNHVFPSGGVTGISYFGVRMKQFGVPAGKSTIVQLMKLVLMFLSFEILLIFGFIVMAAGGHVNGFVLLLCGALSMLMIFGTLGFVYMVGSKRRIDVVFTGTTRFLNRIIHLVRRKHSETIKIDKVRGVVDDLHENYALFSKHRRELAKPFWWAFVANLTEILAIYVVYIAFGHLVNFGAVILAYAVANFAGLVSVLPGGVGVYEGLMTSVLATAGVPYGVSLPVTVAYRLLSTAIQVPPGYFLYHRHLRLGKTKPITAEGS